MVNSIDSSRNILFSLNHKKVKSIKKIEINQVLHQKDLIGHMTEGKNSGKGRKVMMPVLSVSNKREQPVASELSQ